MKDTVTRDLLKAEAHPEQPVLEVINLTKRFEVNGTSISVLADLSFSAGTGEMVCIAGRSGCGKTTLLNILAGFLKPSAGTVLVNGEPIRKPGPDRCVVFQEDTLLPWLTVRENIAFGLKRKVKNKNRLNQEVDRFITLVGLSDFHHYLPRELSGGMKQRVAIARVLILQPQVLLMDEPFASLDYYTRREMQNLLVSIWRDLGQTIVFVTHDVDEAITLADRILVMDRSTGRIREELELTLPRPRRSEQTECVFFRRKLYELL
jgi:NitT/TauT family transport system ATP-binding protein